MSPTTPGQGASRLCTTPYTPAAISSGASSRFSPAHASACIHVHYGLALYVYEAAPRQALGTGKALTHPRALPMIAFSCQDATLALSGRVTVPCLRLSIVPHRRLPPTTCHAWSCISATSQRPYAIFSRRVTRSWTTRLWRSRVFLAARRSVFALLGVSPATCVNLQLRPQKAMKSRLAMICSLPRSFTCLTTQQGCPVGLRRSS